MSARPDLDEILAAMANWDPAVLKQFPALSPPPGLRSNFVDAPDFMPSLIAVTAIICPMMLFVVGLRIYSWTKIGGRVGWDDFTSVLAAILSVTGSGMAIYGSAGWYGKHEWDVSIYTLIQDKWHKVGLQAPRFRC